MPIMISVDPSSKCGLAIWYLDKGVATLTKHKLIKAPPKTPHNDMWFRMMTLQSDLAKEFMFYQPDIVVVENVFVTGTPGRWEGKLWTRYMATTCILLARSFSRDCDVDLIGVTEMKAKVAGSGKATKENVIEAVNSRFPSLLLKTTQDDEADAIGMGLVYLDKKHYEVRAK